MSKGTTPRAIRIDDRLWAKALEVSARRNESVSVVIRDALHKYVERHESPPADDES